MKIVLDLQGAQSSVSFNEYSDKFSLALAKSIVRNKCSHEVIIVLNGLIPESIPWIHEEFSKLLPKENIRVWHAPTPVSYQNSDHTTLRDIAEHIREAFLADLFPDIVYVLSMFEGYDDDIVTSIGRYTQEFPTAVTLFESISSEEKRSDSLRRLPGTGMKIKSVILKEPNSGSPFRKMFAGRASLSLVCRPIR